MAYGTIILKRARDSESLTLAFTDQDAWRQSKLELVAAGYEIKDAFFGYETYTRAKDVLAIASIWAGDQRDDGSL